MKKINLFLGLSLLGTNQTWGMDPSSNLFDRPKASTKNQLISQKWVLAKILKGHEGAILSLAFDPKGKILASGGDNTVRLWDIHRLAEIAILRGHTEDCIKSLAFDSREQLASCSYDKTVRLWDIATTQEKAVLVGHENEVTAVTFCAESILASGDSDGIIRLWDMRTKESISILSAIENVHSIAWDKHRTVLASGVRNGIICFWDIRTGKPLLKIDTQSYMPPKSEKWLHTMTLNPSGSIVTSSTGDHAVTSWDSTNGKRLERFYVDRGDELLTHQVASMAFGSEHVLITGSRDKAVHLWDIRDNYLKPFSGERYYEQTLHGHKGWVNTVAFDANRKLIASGSTDKTICLWQPKDQESNHE